MIMTAAPPPPDEMLADHDDDYHHDDEQAGPPPLLLQLGTTKPHHGHRLALLGPPGSGKTSLAFQAAYALAGRHPDRQAVFLHCRPDGRAVATAVKPLVGLRRRRMRQQHGHEEHEEHEEQEQEQEDSGSWDYSALENVYLKRFTTAQHLLWYLGSLHNQADALLPGAIVIDDLHRFPSSAGHDLATAASRVLSLLRDAADHIRARTGRPCYTLVTMETAGGGGGGGGEAGDGAGAGAGAGGEGMGGAYHPQPQQLEHATRRLIPAFVRQLGAVLRVRRDRSYRGPLPSLSLSPSATASPAGGLLSPRGEPQQGQVFVVEEEPGAAKLSKMVVAVPEEAHEGRGEEVEDIDDDFPPRPPGPCRFLLEARVLRLLV